MRITSKLFVLIFALLALSASAYAQTPREQLQQMVEQLQKTPADNALREKIIKLVIEMKPAPAIPEEAERRMARGTAAFKGAKSAADYQDAIKEFEAAVAAAPWYADAYFNLGVAQDKAEKYADALQSLKWAQLASPDAKDIKALMYEVEFRNEKFNSREAQAAREQAAAENAKQAATKAQEERITGTWQASVRKYPSGRAIQSLEIKHQANGDWSISESLDGGPQYQWEVRDARLVDSNLRFVRPLNPACVGHDVRATASADGNKLSFFITPIHSDVWDNSCAQSVSASEMEPSIREYTRTR